MKKFLIAAYKVLLAAAGTGSIGVGIQCLGEPQGVALAITGGTAIASTVSSAIKDNNLKGVMQLVNFIACNLDKAKNDPIANS